MDPALREALESNGLIMVGVGVMLAFHMIDKVAFWLEKFRKRNGNGNGGGNGSREGDLGIRDRVTTLEVLQRENTRRLGSIETKLDTLLTRSIQ